LSEGGGRDRITEQKKKRVLRKNVVRGEGNYSLFPRTMWGKGKGSKKKGQYLWDRRGTRETHPTHMLNRSFDFNKGKSGQKKDRNREKSPSQRKKALRGAFGKKMVRGEKVLRVGTSAGKGRPKQTKTKKEDRPTKRGNERES